MKLDFPNRQEEAQQTEQIKRPLEVPKPPADTATQVNVYDTIPKKTAALEVHKHLKTASYVAFGAIIGAFLILLTAVFNRTASYLVAFLLIVPAAVYLQKVKSELTRLKKEYNL